MSCGFPRPLLPYVRWLFYAEPVDGVPSAGECVPIQQRRNGNEMTRDRTDLQDQKSDPVNPSYLHRTLRRHLHAIMPALRGRGAVLGHLEYTNDGHE